MLCIKMRRGSLRKLKAYIVITLTLLLTPVTGLTAEETEFLTNWGVSAETVFEKESTPSVKEMMMDGKRILFFEHMLSGRPAGVWYGFDQNKLYISGYSIYVEETPFDIEAARLLKATLDDDVIAALDRPRYMLQDAEDYPAVSDQCSWFRDERTLATGASMIDTEGRYFNYTATFMDADHTDIRPLFQFFDEYWQGIRTDVTFKVKQDLRNP